VRFLPSFGKWLRLASAACILGTLAGTAALAQTPVCNGHNIYPCSIGSTLLVLSKPSFALDGGSGITSGGNGKPAFVNDPQNPGFSLTGYGSLVANGPSLASITGTFSLASVSGQATVSGASASITCGVTGAATYSLTLTTPAGPLVLNCPTVAASGTTTTVTGQIAFSPVSSLSMTLTLAGTATSATDTMTLDALSAQVQMPSSGCVSSVSPSGQAFGPTGGTGSINITTSAGCPWGVFNIPSWVVLTSAASGTGNGTVSYQVYPNVDGPDQSGSLTITNTSFTVEQEGTIAGLNLVGSMAHLAGQENWTTAFTLVNKSSAPATARLSFFGDDNSYSLDPNGNGPLTLPLAFSRQPNIGSILLSASLDRTLGANASLVITTAGPQTPPVLVGSAQLAATGAVDGFAIFHQRVTTQEAVVPMETRNAITYLLPFDNTLAGGVNLVLGVALANISGQAVTVQVVIRNDNGVSIGAGPLPQLAAGDHYQFGLADKFPVTANIRGTIEFNTSSPGQISVLGLRFTPPNNALTTIPALANVGTGGGSIAHLASGGDGWQTTFVLVNTGTSSAQATLSFFADQTGLPMALPLTFPQGHIADTTAPSVTQTIVAGATLLFVSGGAPNLLTGSAQLSTTGHVSGFVIYRHNNQEAVVPLESRNASAYIIAFDNTSGTFTGVAVNAVSAQAVNIPVTVRDDAGTLLAPPDTISLTANGHAQFTLVSDRYPQTLNKRGTIEFDAPGGVPIGAVGIRIPAGLAHTYTTLPALAK
jgi:hypothetical protein